MTARSIQLMFEQYEKSRLNFAKSIAELAMRPTNIPILENENALLLLQPLVSDMSKNVQQNATIALGRLLQYGTDSSPEKLMNLNMLPMLIKDFDQQNKYQKNSILFVLKSLCKHDANSAQFAIDSGVFDVLIASFEDFDVSVKESAAWVCGHIASHNESIAQQCVDNSIIPLLILTLQEPSSLPLKRVALGALADIAKHTTALAQSVVDAGAIPCFMRNLRTTPDNDVKIKRHCLHGLSACAKHTHELAEMVCEADIFPTVFVHMAHACPIVRKLASIVVRDIVKHSLELTQLVVNTGGIAALMEVLLHPATTDDNDNENSSSINNSNKVQCITTIGYIAGHCDKLAMSLLGCNVMQPLAEILNATNVDDDNINNNDGILSVTVWTLGQIGRHSTEHAKAIGVANLYPRIVQLYVAESSSDDLKFKCKTMLKLCLQKCLLLSAIEPLLYDAPPNILKYILAQFTKILPTDPKARRLFVTTGGLKRVQQIEAKPGSTLMEYIMAVNACFPEEIVRYFSPGYPEILLEKVEQYSPQIVTVLREPYASDSDIQTHITAMLDQKIDQLVTND